MEWRSDLTEIPGVHIRDERDKTGILGVYTSRQLAEDVGQDWVYEQVHSQLDTDDEEEEEYPLDTWDGGPVINNGSWSECGLYKQGVSVTAVFEEREVVEHVPGR